MSAVADYQLGWDACAKAYRAEIDALRKAGEEREAALSQQVSDCRAALFREALHAGDMKRRLDTVIRERDTAIESALGRLSRAADSLERSIASLRDEPTDLEDTRG